MEVCLIVIQVLPNVIALKISPRLNVHQCADKYGGPQVQRRNKKSRQNKFQLAAQQNKFAVKQNVTAK